MPTARHLRLSELNDQIAAAISEWFETPVWVLAEVVKCSFHPPSGHTYLELAEKQGEKPVALAKATLWKYSRHLLDDFEEVTGRQLAAGMQALLCVKVSFHPVHGLNLNIQDIDATYTLGDIARKRQELIDRLADSGLLGLNRMRQLAPVAQRLAIVSSPTAAGLGDFTRRLAENRFGYDFRHVVFQAAVQGEGAQDSLLEALSAIRRRSDEFDCVVLVRGGGSGSDLACFDGEAVATAIAEFPLPVITGIGHERDESVADMVAHYDASTPSGAAEFLIARARAFEETVNGLADRLDGAAHTRLRESVINLDRSMARFAQEASTEVSEAEDALESIARRIAESVRRDVALHMLGVTEAATRLKLNPRARVATERASLSLAAADLGRASQRFLERASFALMGLEREVRTRDPADILRRGFSITRCNGRAVRSMEEVEPGAEIETSLAVGGVTSAVTETWMPLEEMVSMWSNE